jgi:hypothetical protein
MATIYGSYTAIRYPLLLEIVLYLPPLCSVWPVHIARFEGNECCLDSIGEVYHQAL